MNGPLGGGPGASGASITPDQASRQESGVTVVKTVVVLAGTAGKACRGRRDGRAHSAEAKSARATITDDASITKQKKVLPSWKNWELEAQI